MIFIRNDIYSLQVDNSEITQIIYNYLLSKRNFNLFYLHCGWYDEREQW